MDYTKTLTGSSCNIKIKGKFTFSDHKEFKLLFSVLADDSVQSLNLNFAAVEFIDSAALGILLLARDEAEKFSKGVVLQNPVGQVKQMFEVSRFYDLFQIEN